MKKVLLFIGMLLCAIALVFSIIVFVGLCTQWNAEGMLNDPAWVTENPTLITAQRARLTDARGLIDTWTPYAICFSIAGILILGLTRHISGFVDRCKNNSEN